MAHKSAAPGSWPLAMKCRQSQRPHGRHLTSGRLHRPESFLAPRSLFAQPSPPRAVLMPTVPCIHCPNLGRSSLAPLTMPRRTPQLDASNLHAMHHVKPTFTNKDGKEEDNCVVVSVKDNKKQMLAHCSVPVKLIRDSTGINPVTGEGLTVARVCAGDRGRKTPSGCCCVVPR